MYWASSAGGNGAGDGYYSFSARAFSTTGYVGEASTLIGSMKVETGPPPPVTNPRQGTGIGTAGNDGVVNLHWTASTATDLDHYVVYRCDAERHQRTLIAGGPAGWTAHRDDRLGLDLRRDLRLRSRGGRLGRQDERSSPSPP